MITNGQEYEAAKRKIVAQGYDAIGFDDLFTPVVESALGQISEKVTEMHGGEADSDKRMDEMIQGVGRHLIDTYPKITTYEAVLVFASALMTLMPSILYVGSGNQLEKRDS